MAGSIGKASLILGATWSKLSAGLNTAYTEVKGWKGKVGSLLGGGGGLLAAAAGGLTGGLFAGGAAAAASAVAGKFTAISEAADRAAKDARRLGTSTEDMSGLIHAAGMSGVGLDALSGSLRKFRQHVDGDMMAALEALGDRLAGTDDPAERARIAVEAFGKSGLDMLTLFEGGGQGLRDMVAEAKELGVALSDADAAKFEAANDSISRVGTALTGLVQRVMVAAAPAVDFFAVQLTEGIKLVQPAIDWFGRGIEAGAAVIVPLVSEIAASFWAGIAVLAEWAGAATDFGFEWPTIGEVVTSVLRTIGKALAYTWDTLKAGAGIAAQVVAAIVDKFADLLDAFKGTIKSLLEAAAKLPSALGGDYFARQAQEVDQLGNRTRELAGEMAARGQAAVAAWGQSAAQVDAWFDRLGQKADGLGKKVKEIKDDDLGEQLAAAGIKFAAAMERGSSQDYSYRIRYEMGSAARSAQDRQLGEARNTNRKLDAANGHLAKLAARPPVKLGEI